ncbi:HutD family protein [Methylobacterium sp. J-030]|nr:HutD family protein [Methylobacterium sp. J-030]
MPWKNGGGETIEIALGPDGAALDRFDWRVSAATVGRDGPFSAFPGIDRTLCVLDGGRIELAVGDAPPMRLDEGSPPFAFAADAACAARLVDGPITGLNVMSRRGRLTHSVRRIDLGRGIEVRASGDTVLLFSASGALAVEAGAGPVRLDARDCLMGGGTVDWRVSAVGPAVRSFLITFHVV